MGVRVSGLGYSMYSERRGPAMGFKTSVLVNIMKFKMMVTGNVSAVSLE